MLRESDVGAVDLADSDKVVAGDMAIAIGNAQGYGIATSSGIVSVDSEYITMTAPDEITRVSYRVMRIDTAVNPGNSGGGLYDATGNLIGIVNAKFVDDDVENIGYAIPSNAVATIADNIIDYCYGTEIERAQRAEIGIRVTVSDSKAVYDSEAGTYTIRETVSVKDISTGSPTDGLLQVGDVLLRMEWNGAVVNIDRQYHVVDAMMDFRPGDTVRVTLLREGVETTVDILVTEDCLTVY